MNRRSSRDEDSAGRPEVPGVWLVHRPTAVVRERCAMVLVDAVLLDEMDLLADVITAVSCFGSHLTQLQVDGVLGVTPGGVV